MPAWASDPIAWLRKGALSGAFFAFAAPAWAEVDLNGFWQNITLNDTPCQDTARTFADGDGILTIREPADIFGPSEDYSWRHGGWQDGGLELIPAGPGVVPSVLFESPEGVVLCPKDRATACHHFRRCPMPPGS